MTSRVCLVVLALCVAGGGINGQHRVPDRGTIAYSWKLREAPPEPCAVRAYPWTRGLACTEGMVLPRYHMTSASTVLHPCGVCRHDPCTAAHLYDKNRDLISSMRSVHCVSSNYLFNLESRNDAAYIDARDRPRDPCTFACPPPRYAERRSLQGLNDELVTLHSQCYNCR